MRGNKPMYGETICIGLFSVKERTEIILFLSQSRGLPTSSGVV